MIIKRDFYVILHRFASWEKGRWNAYPSDTCPQLFRKKVGAKFKMKKVKALDSRRMMRVEPAVLSVPGLEG